MEALSCLTWLNRCIWASEFGFWERKRSLKDGCSIWSFTLIIFINHIWIGLSLVLAYIRAIVKVVSALCRELALTLILIFQIFIWGNFFWNFDISWMFLLANICSSRFIQISEHVRPCIYSTWSRWLRPVTFILA